MILDLSYEKCEYLLFSMKDIIPLPHLFDRHVVYFLIFEERVYFQDNLFKFHFKIAGLRVIKGVPKIHNFALTTTAFHAPVARRHLFEIVKNKVMSSKTIQVYKKKRSSPESKLYL